MKSIKYLMAAEFGLNQNILTGFDIDFLLSNLNLLNHIRNEVYTYLNEPGKNNTRLFRYAPKS